MANISVTVPQGRPDRDSGDSLEALDEMEFLDDVEFTLEEVENKIAPLALAHV